MKVTPLSIPDVLLIEPEVHGDDRGFFFESFNQMLYSKAIGRKVTFVQDNHSKSLKGVLRGLHYQLPPKAQGKLVRAIQGEVFDVAVDIRKSSPTFGKWVGEIISSANKKQMWVPEGFAHGFLTLSNEAELSYKTTDYFSPENERSIIWNEVNIEWPTKLDPILSKRDSNGSSWINSDFFE